jgi:serpin B
VQALRALNVSAPFRESEANFSRMSAQPLMLSDVLQSVTMIVNEAGTEAAAVTSVVMVATSYQPDPLPPLVFDRPFVFMVMDEASGDVLFMGTVRDPTMTS